MRNVLILAAVALGACTSSNGDNGAEPRATGQRSFETGNFQAVKSEGPHDVIVTVGAPASVRAQGDSELLERLDIRVEDGVLRIGNRRESWMSGSHRSRGVTVHVSMPAIAEASIEGSGDLNIDRVQSDSFAAAIAGSGDMAIGTLQARDTRFSIAGSGDIRAAGAADQANISIMGSGNVSAELLQVRRATITVAGSGDISLGATEAVDGSIMGSGDLHVRGGARCSVTKAGSGDIDCS